MYFKISKLHSWSKRADQVRRHNYAALPNKKDGISMYFFRNDYSIPNIEARSLSGSYLLGVEAFEFRALMAQYGHTVWYFMVAYPRSKPEGLLVAERFFKGILIDRQLRSPSDYKAE